FAPCVRDTTLCHSDASEPRSPHGAAFLRAPPLQCPFGLVPIGSLQPFRRRGTIGGASSGAGIVLSLGRDLHCVGFRTCDERLLLCWQRFASPPRRSRPTPSSRSRP